MSRSYAEKGVVAQVGTDTPVALRIRATAAAGAVTSVTTVTGTAITAITANGGSEVWDFATYSTIGLLADRINASVYWECKILDTIRSFATDDQFVDGAISASAVNGISYYDVLVDTSEAKYFAYRLSNDRSVGEDYPVAGHRVHLQEFVYYATLGNVTADDVQVWETKPNGTETQKMGLLSVSATETTENFVSGRGKLTAADGNDLVIVLVDDTTLADSADNYLRVTGISE